MKLINRKILKSEKMFDKLGVHLKYKIKMFNLEKTEEAWADEDELSVALFHLDSHQVWLYFTDSSQTPLWTETFVKAVRQRQKELRWRR